MICRHIVQAARHRPATPQLPRGSQTVSHGHAMVRPIVAQAGFYRPSGMLERMWSGEQTILHQQGTLAQLAESWRVMPQLLGQAVGLEQHSAPQHLLEYEGQNECGAEPSSGKSGPTRRDRLIQLVRGVARAGVYARGRLQTRRRGCQCARTVLNRCKEPDAVGSTNAAHT